MTLYNLCWQVSCKVRASGYRKTVPVIVRVTDINDNTPEFVRLPYRTRIPEVGDGNCKRMRRRYRYDRKFGPRL